MLRVVIFIHVHNNSVHVSKISNLERNIAKKKSVMHEKNIYQTVKVKSNSREVTG